MLENDTSTETTSDAPFPDPGEASRNLAITIQVLNVLGLALNVSLAAALCSLGSRTGAKGVLLLTVTEIGINMSLLIMHSELWAGNEKHIHIVEKFNFSFEAFHLLRNFWLCVMTIARTVAVRRPFLSRALLSRKQQAYLFSTAAAFSAAWSCLDLLLVNYFNSPGAKSLSRALALIRHFLNTVVAGSVIVTTAALIVYHIRRTNVFNFRRRESQASKIVVTISVAFMLLELPYAFVVYLGIIRLMTTGISAFPKYFAEIVHILYRVNHLLIVIDTCLNLFVMLIFSSSFRLQLLLAIRRRCSKSRKLNRPNQRRQLSGGDGSTIRLQKRTSRSVESTNNGGKENDAHCSRLIAPGQPAVYREDQNRVTAL